MLLTTHHDQLHHKTVWTFEVADYEVRRLKTLPPAYDPPNISHGLMFLSGLAEDIERCERMSTDELNIRAQYG